MDEEDQVYAQPSGSQETAALQTGPEAPPSKLAVSETSPLLPRARASSASRTRSKRRRQSVSHHGDATVGQAVLMVRHLFVTQHRYSLLIFIYVAVEIVRRDRGFVFGKGVSPTAEAALLAG